MLGGELSFHFMNVMLLTVVVAPLVLWRYRRAVLAGMQDRGRRGAAAGAAARAGRAPRQRRADSPSPRALAWEARMRRRIFVAVLAALVRRPRCCSPRSTLAVGDLPLTPAHLFLIAGTATLSMAVPIFAVLTATPFWRALRLGVVDAVRPRRARRRALDAAAAVLRQGADARPGAQLRLLRPASPRYTLWLPIAARRGDRRAARSRRRAARLRRRCWCSRLAPLLGVHLTQWLLGHAVERRLGPGRAGHRRRHRRPRPAGRPARLVAAEGARARLRGEALFRRAAARPQLVADRRRRRHAVELVDASIRARAPLLQILAVSAVAYFLFPFLLARALALGAARRAARRRRARCCCCASSATPPAPRALFDRIASRWQRFGPVTMIAAPDVAAGTVDPGDVLRFATGDIDDRLRHVAATTWRDGSRRWTSSPIATAAIASTSSAAATTPGRRPWSS